MTKRIAKQEVKERPILFNSAMVRALLDGSKTQTRRLVKGFQIPKLDTVQFDDSDKYVAVTQNHPRYDFCVFGPTEQACADKLAQSGCCPFGKVGDQLWVRETFGEVYDWCDHPEMPGAQKERWHIDWKYRADGEVESKALDGAFTGWKSSIHMPRSASRIQLEITGVRVERLNEISEKDAKAEGIPRRGDGFGRWHPDPNDSNHTGTTQDPRLSFKGLWESISGAGSWKDNPWVWAIEFKRVAA